MERQLPYRDDEVGGNVEQCGQLRHTRVVTLAPLKGTQLLVRCASLSRMTQLGMPGSYKA
jgi:hypothetical protein